MDNTQETTRKAFPTAFLSHLAEELETSLEEMLRAHGISKEARSAVDTLTYLITLMYTTAEEFRPGSVEGYNRECRDAVETAAWAIDTLKNMARERVQAMSDEEYKQASKN